MPTDSVSSGDTPDSRHGEVASLVSDDFQAKGCQTEYGIMRAKNSDHMLPQQLISLGNALRICDMETVVLDPSLQKAEVDSIDSIVVGEAVLCRIETDFSFRGRFAIPADWCLLGCMHEANGASGCGGIPISSGTAFTVFSGGISEFVFGADSRVTIMLVPLQRLKSKFSELVHPGLEIPVRLLGMFKLQDAPLAAALYAHYEKMHRDISPVSRENAAPIQALEKDLDILLKKHLLAGLSVQAEHRPQCSRGRQAHYQIVQRAEHYMRENMRRVIYIDELCDAAGVSERALRYAFDDLLGLSPNRYLAMLRLCTAFRALAVADASRRSVKSVALSCGLWDLSRFADHYRNTFGELPRDTLMRAPPEGSSALSPVREAS